MDQAASSRDGYSHLKLDKNAIQTIPAEKLEIVPR
jgi:hypothetical protein